MAAQSLALPKSTDEISEPEILAFDPISEQSNEEQQGLITKNDPGRSLLDDAEAEVSTIPASLDAAAVSHARSYYVTQPQKFTPAVIGDIQDAVGAARTEKVDDDMIQGVARFQAGINKSRAPTPPLAVDGIAGPRTLPILIPVGLATDAAVEGYVADVKGAKEDLDKAETPEEKAAILAIAVNKQLSAAGVPTVVVILNADDANRFSPDSWQISLQPKELDDPNAGATILYHEARHAEQSWRIARMLAGQGRTEAQIVAETGIQAGIVAQAVKQPIAAGTVEALQAQGWHEREIGKESSEQSKARMSTATSALVTAIVAWKKSPTPQSEARMNAAYAEYQRAYLAYRNQPEEYDGFFVAERVGDQLDVPRDSFPTLAQLAEQVPG